MPTRREMLARSASVAAALAGLGQLPAAAQASWPQAAFEARNLADVAKALGIALPVESKDVTLTGPEIAENGAVVPIVAATTLPGAKRLLLMIEKNPAMLAAVFELGEAIEPAVSTRIKMAESSQVIAAVVTAEGKVFFAKKEIKVTLGGCGG